MIIIVVDICKFLFSARLWLSWCGDNRFTERENSLEGRQDGVSVLICLLRCLFSGLLCLPRYVCLCLYFLLCLGVVLSASLLLRCMFFFGCLDAFFFLCITAFVSA